MLSNKEIILLAACSMLRIQTLRPEDGALIILKPTDADIKAAVKVVRRVSAAIEGEV